MQILRGGGSKLNFRWGNKSLHKGWILTRLLKRLLQILQLSRFDQIRSAALGAGGSASNSLQLSSSSVVGSIKGLGLFLRQRIEITLESSEERVSLEKTGSLTIAVLFLRGYRELNLLLWHLFLLGLSYSSESKSCSDESKSYSIMDFLWEIVVSLLELLWLL